MELTKKPIKFAHHARNRMRWHKISEEEVVSCIRMPLLQEPARKGKTHSWQRVGTKFLRVTWLEEEDATIIITAVLKRRPPKGLRP